VPIEWEQVDVTGVESGDKHTEDLFEQSIASIKRNKLALKGILHTPIERSGHNSFNVAMRQELDAYASVVLIKNIPGLETRHKNVDLCIIRENTEGEYSGLEHQSVSGVVESLKIITRTKSERIAKFACAFAIANNRKKVTAIHKANIMKLADGLFRNTVKRVAEDYPTLEYNDMIVDNASMQAVSRPQQFDVMVMPNLYGGKFSTSAALPCANKLRYLDEHRSGPRWRPWCRAWLQHGSRRRHLRARVSSCRSRHQGQRPG